jgi:dipeptidyl aminopeptidase/acylaminoacyl peptidase
MNKSSFTIFVGLAIVAVAASGESVETGNPTEHLPPQSRQLTSFGERPDWSPDGKRILFLTKTFGDAMELDVVTGAIRNLTAFYPHYGYTRALYLANGDILLSGPVVFDPKKAGQARNECQLFILDKAGARPPQPLGVRCNEGPAVSRHRLHLAWTEWTPPGPGDANLSSSIMYEAEIDYAPSGPQLTARRLIVDGRNLPFRCTMETQNFRPPAETELTFSAYTEGGRKSDVCGIDLRTGKVTKYTDSADTYDEPEGIYPDGLYTLVECDRQNHLGPGHIDLWRLKLDGSGEYVRLTHFSDFPNYKASNPVVSDDGRYIAFQMGRAGEAAGVGHGIFLYDLSMAP